MAGHAAGEWAARRAGSGCLEAAAAAAAAARDLPGNSAVVAAQRARTKLHRRLQARRVTCRVTWSRHPTDDDVTGLQLPVSRASRRRRRKLPNRYIRHVIYV